MNHDVILRILLSTEFRSESFSKATIYINFKMYNHFNFQHKEHPINLSSRTFFHRISAFSKRFFFLFLFMNCIFTNYCVCFFFCRIAKRWAGAGVFESNKKCYSRFGTRSDFGVFGEKHRRTQGEFRSANLFIHTFNMFLYKI